MTEMHATTKTRVDITTARKVVAHLKRIQSSRSEKKRVRNSHDLIEDIYPIHLKVKGESLIAHFGINKKAYQAA